METTSIDVRYAGLSLAELKAQAPERKHSDCAKQRSATRKNIRLVLTPVERDHVVAALDFFLAEYDSAGASHRRDMHVPGPDMTPAEFNNLLQKVVNAGQPK